jgi:hypothetical protein
MITLRKTVCIVCNKEFTILVRDKDALMHASFGGIETPQGDICSWCAWNTPE